MHPSRRSVNFISGVYHGEHAKSRGLFKPNPKQEMRVHALCWPLHVGDIAVVPGGVLVRLVLSISVSRAAPAAAALDHGGEPDPRRPSARRRGHLRGLYLTPAGTRDRESVV